MTLDVVTSPVTQLHAEEVEEDNSARSDFLQSVESVPLHRLVNHGWLSPGLAAWAGHVVPDTIADTGPIHGPILLGVHICGTQR